MVSMRLLMSMMAAVGALAISSVATVVASVSSSGFGSCFVGAVEAKVNAVVTIW